MSPVCSSAVSYVYKRQALVLLAAVLLALGLLASVLLALGLLALGLLVVAVLAFSILSLLCFIFPPTTNLLK